MASSLNILSTAEYLWSTSCGPGTVRGAGTEVSKRMAPLPGAPGAGEEASLHQALTLVRNGDSPEHMLGGKGAWLQGDVEQRILGWRQSGQTVRKGHELDWRLCRSSPGRRGRAAGEHCRQRSRVGRKGFGRTKRKSVWQGWRVRGEGC